MTRSYHAITRSVRTLWLISPVVLITLLAVVLVRQAVPAGASTQLAKTAAGPPAVTLLASFPATGLPAGPAQATAVIVHVPANLHFTHVHGGNVYSYVISGAVTSIDNRGARTYRPGQFFWEPVGH